MKSTINTLADYREAPFEKNVTVSCPEEHIQKQIKHLTRGHKKTKAVQTVEKGDVVVLALESEISKFNRPAVPVTVGGNLFDAEFEKQLSGHAVGETFTVTVQEKPVKVTVKQASRTIFPEATDEMAAEYAAEHEEFSDVRTLEEFRNSVIKKYIDGEKQKVIFNAMDEVLSYVLTHSDWEFDEEEIAEHIKAANEEIQQYLQEEGRTLESLTEKDLRMNYGVDTLEDLEKLIKSSAEQRIATELMLSAIHKKASVGEIEGDPWAFLQEYVEKNLTITEEK